jgi:diketogulonate reductase-like aldo/keto reductase
VLKHPEILKLATRIGKSTANVVIAWHLQVLGNRIGGREQRD